MQKAILYPNNALSSLEFDRILDLVKANCSSTIGQNIIESIVPLSDITTITENHKALEEFFVILEEHTSFPSIEIPDLSRFLKPFSIEGYVLDIDQAQKIRALAFCYLKIFTFFRKHSKFIQLNSILEPLVDAELIHHPIDYLFTEEGEIKESVSPELIKVRKSIRSENARLNNVFNKSIHQYRSLGYLKDNLESMRNGRRVLVVQAEAKRKVKGIIHDESASGQTSFIEPQQTIEINNRLVELDIEERRIIYKLLVDLSNQLRPYCEDLNLISEALGLLDSYRAKAIFGRSIKGISPNINEKITLHFDEAIHPLLYLANKPKGEKTVPFTLKLENNNRILLLSGPNAGGKSVCMKAAGLLQVMFQAGLPISVSEDTKMTVYNKIFTDIGDQQDIENDLSTYSSHLKNMNYFTRKSDNSTLILIDEFGTGTDPEIGGAIAQAVLHRLNYLNCCGVITTHYSNLKSFAFKSKGIVNAAMIFDTETLNPTYELKVGKPGSSYAIEIAEKSKIHPKVIENAKRIVGDKKIKVDDLLVNLESRELRLKEQKESLEKNQRTIDRLMKTYNVLLEELDKSKKEFKIERKAKKLEKIKEDSNTLNQFLQTLKDDEKAQEKVKKVMQEKRSEQISITKEIKSISTKVEKTYSIEDFKVGQIVRLENGVENGIIEAIKGKKATVVFEHLKTQVPLKRLIPSEEKKSIIKPKRKMDLVEASSQFKSKIDVRGFSMIDAVDLIEKFIDEALIVNAAQVEIIHGKGNGILRQATLKKLKEYKRHISNIKHGHPERSGDGITIVEF